MIEGGRYLNTKDFSSNLDRKIKEKKKKKNPQPNNSPKASRRKGRGGNLNNHPTRR